MSSYSAIPDILKKNSLKYDDKTALIDGVKRISYRDLENRSSALAAYLTEKGVAKGDRVGVFLEKNIDSVVAIWGVAKAGGISVIINTRLHTSQVRYCLDNSSVRCIISSGRKKHLLGVSSDEVPVFDTDLFRSIYEQYSYDAGEVADLSSSDPAVILYTSGSTGYPKGVVLNHRNLISAAERSVYYLKSASSDVIISILPFDSDYGLCQLLISIYSGGTLVLQRSMHPMHICSSFIEHRVTGCAGVPTMWMQLLQPRYSFRELEFPDLRYISIAGDRMPSSYMQELRSVLKNQQFFIFYGLTESFRTTCLMPEDADLRPDSIGKETVGVKVYVVNDRNKICPPGEEGELVHSGEGVFMHYWNDPESTARVLKPLSIISEDISGYGVWTGDIALRDSSDYLYLLGRKDFLIKTAGYRISTQYIEDVLYGTGAIREAAVYGVKDVLLGERINALVSLKDGEEISPDEIISLCKKELPNYMVPHDVVIVPELPKTPNGKIDRPGIISKYGVPYEKTPPCP